MTKRHLILPDTQCRKGDPVRHFEWVAQAINDYKPDVVIHLGDHWDFPSLSSYDGPGSLKMEGARVQDDIEAGNETFRTLNRLITHKCKKILLRGNHECLSEDTEVLVQGKGFVHYGEVTSGDFVWSLNRDCTGSWKRVSYVVEREYSGKMLRTDSRTVSSLVTPNHRVIYTSNGTDNKYREVLAKDSLVAPDFFVSAVPSDNQGIDLSDDEIRLAAWMSTDSYYKPDGLVVLYQRESNAWRISELLNRLSVSYREKIRNRDIKQICGKVLKKKPEAGVEFHIEDDVCSRVQTFSNKVLPSWTEKLNQYQWEVFLETLIEADGSIPTRATNSRVFYGAKRICEDVQIAAVTHGWRCSLTEYREGHWRANLCRERTGRQCNPYKEDVDYEGIVWCLGVEDNENFLVRRNNKCHFTGNCRMNKAINKDPRLVGTLGDHLLESPGWQVVPYYAGAPGQITVDGVVYSHFFPVPNTGKPIGGTIQNRLQKIGQSFVHGHVQGLMQGTHQFATGRTIQGIQAGSLYLHDEDYKGPANRHWRGIVVLNEVQNGSFCEMPLSVDYLCRKYEGMSVSRFLNKNYKSAKDRFSLARET